MGSETRSIRHGHAAGLLSAALVVVLAAACSKPSGWSREEVGGAVLTPPIPKPAFTLTDTRGQQFDFKAETRGSIALLFFGYTHCPDVCPVHLANIAAAMHRLDPDVARQIKVVFVTTDSARDTPERMRQWLDAFDPGFIGLTGSLDRVNAIQQSLLHMGPAFTQPNDKGSYDVAHSAVVLAFTRDDSAHIVYPFGVRQSAWAADLKRLVEDGPPR